MLMEKSVSLMRSDWLKMHEKGPSVKTDLVSLKSLWKIEYINIW